MTQSSKSTVPTYQLSNTAMLHIMYRTSCLIQSCLHLHHATQRAPVAQHNEQAEPQNLLTDPCLDRYTSRSAGRTNRTAR